MSDLLPPEPEPNRRTFLTKIAGTSLILGIGGITVWQNRHRIQQVAKDSRQQTKPNPPTVKVPAQPTILPHESNYAAFLGKLKLRHIAPHEILAAHRRERNGVRNELPPRQLWNRLIPTLRVADELRVRLGCKLSYIASAYRSPEYNRQCPGAAKHSYHTKNNALDLIYECGSEAAMREAKQMRREGKFHGGLGLYSSFIHIDTRGHNSTWG